MVRNSNWNASAIVLALAMMAGPSSAQTSAEFKSIYIVVGLSVGGGFDAAHGPIHLGSTEYCRAEHPGRLQFEGSAVSRQRDAEGRQCYDGIQPRFAERVAG